MPRALIVSIHDVSPRTMEPTQALLDSMAQAGVTRTSLLVVPDHHRRGHFLEHPAFCAWLSDLASAGHELVVHGYYHQRERRPAESLRDRIVTRFYTADEGEFFDLPEEEALFLMNRAKEEFAQMGWRPAGFIAPAWLLGAGAERAARAAGFKYTTRLGGVSRLDRAETWPSQSLVWSVRSRWRRVMSLAWNASLFDRLRENPLLRLGLHPPDLQYPGILQQIRKLTRRALVDREPVTYERWVEQAAR